MQIKTFVGLIKKGWRVSPKQNNAPSNIQIGFLSNAGRKIPLWRIYGDLTPGKMAALVGVS